MTVCSSLGGLRSAWRGALAALLLAVALPLAGSDSTQAQRRGQPQMQGGPPPAQLQTTPSDMGPQGGAQSTAPVRVPRRARAGRAPEAGGGGPPQRTPGWGYADPGGGY
jgi:hypothetical protein